MVVWGGLRPIVTQVVVDVLGLVGFGYTVVTIPSRTNTMVLGVVSLLTILLSGNWTNRWTVIFPMIPLVVLQIIRRVVFHYSNKNKRRSACLSYTIGSLCFLLIFVAGGLSLLFPAVELPPLPSSVYNVGVVDVFLPTKIQYKSTIPDIHEGVCSKESDHVTVRILYPTMDEVGSPIPYLRPHTSEAFCQETMKYGAPPPLKEFGWMLHTWRLTQIPAFHHAQPLLLGKSSPMIVFSPGVGGTAEIYSYQTLALAANGYVVVVVEHADGSAPVVSRQDGSVLRRDVSVEQEWHDGNKERYKRSRRAMTEFRTEEFLAAVESMISLNTQNIEALESIGLSFVGKLNTTEIHYMGHSFGGSTSMHASLRGRPPTSVIAHEPVADWLPDQTRYSLFEKQRLEGTNYTNLIVHEDTATAATGGPSIHDRNMLLLFSNEWHTKEWGYIPVFKDMDERKQLGPKGGVSRVQVIDGANHNEFSDTSMLTPTWLAREVGLTGPRNPLDTAWDIHEATMDFLNQVRVQSR